MVSLFCNVVLPLSFIFVVLSSFGCAIGLVFGIATKAAIVLSIFSFPNCSGYGFMLIFFLNLGFYYNDVAYSHK